jgi:hypothetical protein
MTLIEVMATYDIGIVNAPTVFGEGLINSTMIVSSERSKTPNNSTIHQYILQRINDKIFTNPHSIDDNINLISRFLTKFAPSYKCLQLVTNVRGDTLVQNEHGYYRLFEFIQESVTYTRLLKPEQAFEAACMFGEYTMLLQNIDLSKLQITLSDFHNLPLRQHQYTVAVTTCMNQTRLVLANLAIEQANEHGEICQIYQQNIINNPAFKLRVTHHDTKISNVLFDKQDKGQF